MPAKTKIMFTLLKERRQEIKVEAPVSPCHEGKLTLICRKEKVLLIISKELFRQIVQVILKRKTAAKILLFGSQARQEPRRTSDIDIAVVDREWTDRDINLAKHAREEEINIPVTIDLVHFDSLKNGRLREHILKEGKVIYESGKN